jgi:hypothetical protein
MIVILGLLIDINDVLFDIADLLCEIIFLNVDIFSPAMNYPHLCEIISWLYLLLLWTMLYQYNTQVLLQICSMIEYFAYKYIRIFMCLKH